MPLAFPSSQLPESREIEFRDGKRVIPEYLADLMAGLDTIRYTYAEACQRVNWSLASDHVNRAQDKILRDHFKGGLG